MRCRNCGHSDRFVLLAELSVVADAADQPQPGFSDPDWSLSLSCEACASTDVAGDPVDLLADRVR